MEFLDCKGMPKMTSQFKEDHSLAHQLFQYIFGLYCLIAVIVTGIQIYEEYKFTKNAIAKELETYQSIFSPILEQALWNLDREQVDVVSDAIMSVPIIVGVKIERFQGKRLISYIDKGIEETTSSEQFSYSFPIVYTAPGTKQPLGEATLYSDSSIVLERLKLGFIFLIINALIKGIALWFIFWWVSRKFLIRPLNSLIEFISSIHFESLDDMKVDLNIKNKNELSVIESTFNDMINEIIHAKKAITDFNNQLEKNVSKRTIELNIAKEEAEKATIAAELSSQAKNDFLSVISHELRTPMSGIQGSMYLLRKTDLDEKQLKYLEMTDICTHRMLQLISDMLDTIKIDNGSLLLQRSEFDIHKELVSLFNDEIDNNKNTELDISYNIDAIKDTLVIGDKDRVIQIFKYLMSNALKFTESGFIKIDISKQALKSGDQKFVRIYASIEDSGIGIDARKLDTLFDSFFIGDSSSTREHMGSGLGLSICKKLCEMMNGSISVTSKLGKGSLFKFEIVLPLAR